MSAKKIISILVGTVSVLGLSTAAYAACGSMSDDACMGKDQGAICGPTRTGTCVEKTGSNNCYCREAEEIDRIFDSTDNLDPVFNEQLPGQGMNEGVNQSTVNDRLLAE